MTRVGIKQFQLEEWMFGSSWNYIVPTRRIDDCIKLELDSSNTWIVIEPEDRRFTIELKITIFINWRYFMIWRLIKDFKFDIVFSTCFDYDIETYYI